MRIAVTGSSGRIGTMLLRHLLTLGHDVVGIDVKPALDPGLPATHLSDLKDARPLAELFAGVEAVCHLANHPSLHRLPSLADGFANNLVTTFNVFAAAETAGVRRVVNASSVQAYGFLAHGGVPDIRVTAPCYVPVDEDHPLLPVEAYPLSKSLGEGIAESFARRRPDLTAVSLRLTFVINLPRAAGFVARPAPPGPPPLTASLLTSVQASEVTRAFALACALDRPGHTPLNIAGRRSMHPWTTEMFEETYGAVPEIRGSLSADDALIATKRAQSVLGFVAKG